MDEFPKAYDPKGVEEKQYRFWEEGGFFKADARSPKKPYTIVIPPPNVTGVLHMGHALVNTVQDVLVRWKRMCGDEALWVPGTDHAGIATQTVVERQLMKEGKRRADLPREKFVERVWAWKEESEKLILNQIRRVGCSCDWDRLAFTMDAKRSRAVRTVFKKMYDAGLIYRGDRLVNWDPVTETALADDEVEYEERESELYYIRYPVVGSEQFLVVATTRPETLLGDTAVAVSPEDIRYQLVIGKSVVVPLVNRQVPVVGDALIDPQFGTGVVKVTPAHDPNDYAVAERHGLPMINIMTPDGKILEGEFKGLSMEAARRAVALRLKELGLLEKVEKHRHRVGVSYRSKAVIEPYLSKQWFVKMSHFKSELVELVRSKRVRLIPENFENTYFYWIHNLRDWCISRQLWWGHQIPIWYKKGDPEVMICSEEGPKDPENWVQDPDVLDTWFSSALWPLSVLGWPEQTDDLKKFYPTSVLVTGHDILFFWVARMIMMGDYLTKTPPFSTVFLHGLIFGKSYWRYQADGSVAYLSSEERQKYDLGETLPAEVQSRWEKMSKSKGNIIDPLEIIDAFGADAMRMALAASTTHARQIDLDRRRFEEFKNFANKVWNGARFVFMNLEGLDVGGGLELEHLEDRWMISRLNRIIAEVNAALHEFAFDKAALAAYDFFWKEFCAYYVELAKPTLFGKRGTPQDKRNKQKILLVVLCSAVRLLHPMAPFITEELFGLLKAKSPSLVESQDPYLQECLQALQAPGCIVAPYPKVIRETDLDPEVEEEFAAIDQIVHAVRNIRAEMQVAPGTATALYLVGPEKSLAFVKKHQSILEALVRLASVTCVAKEPILSLASMATVGELKIVIPLPAEMRDKERARLTKEQEKLVQQEQAIRARLANPDFAAKAPLELVDKLRAQLEQMERDLVEMAKKLERF